MARKRNQHGSIRVLSRKSGDTFEYRYYRTRADGERVAANFVVGTVVELKTKAGAWARLRTMGFDPNAAVSKVIKPVTFGELAKDYIRVELSDDQSEAAIPKAYPTIETYRRYIKRHVLPRWETVRASDMDPIEVQNWLRQLRKERERAVEPELGEDSECHAGDLQTRATVWFSAQNARSQPDIVRAPVLRQRLRTCGADTVPVRGHPLQPG